jgi:hypothetical protein
LQRCSISAAVPSSCWQLQTSRSGGADEMSLAGAESASWTVQERLRWVRASINQ